ncbi:unnamed protein product [Adineta steineri]|uniref:AMP-dependent synthetase/ligase domain-containing protein n=1 Tax=Adineta steineri TaxID=433720 RepID=A0A816FQK1_9BILA|nr:unnamed protein product [Adineta steineri]CAF1664817.1 unnamed protein product [Adineta steineri]
MQSMNNTEVSFSSSVTCIHHAFVYQVIKNPQKLAVELDEQSLTYAELLHYVQVLSLILLTDYLITPGEVVIGILSIALVGGAYCPLSSRDPPQRLQVLVNQAHSRLVMVHSITAAAFSSGILSLNIESVIHLEERSYKINLNKLSDVPVTPENVVFVIFTSGSTGIPKAVNIITVAFDVFSYTFFLKIGSVTASKLH